MTLCIMVDPKHLLLNSTKGELRIKTLGKFLLVAFTLPCPTKTETEEYQQFVLGLTRKYFFPFVKPHIY